MNQTKILSLLFLFWTLSAHAGIGPELIKGVDELIDPKCQERISPVYAMGMLKSGVLTHIRFWGSFGKVPHGEEINYPSCRWAPRLPNPEHPGQFLKEVDPNECPLDHTSALIQSLFPSHAGVELIANQGSTDDPLSKLTPENLGHLIELLEHWTIPREGEPDDLWTLQVYQALHLEDSNIKQVTLEALSHIQSECERYHQDSRKISHLIRNLKEVSSKGAESHQKKRMKFDLEHSLSVLKGTKRWKAIEPWSTLLFKAVQESKRENNPYPQSIVTTSLLSYLLMKGDGKAPLLEFLSATPSCLSEKGRTLISEFAIIQQEIRQQRAQESASAELQPSRELREFLESRFRPTDYTHFLADPHEEVKSLHQDPERLGYFLYQRSFSDLPPLVGGQQAAHKSLGKSQSDRKYRLYPDCGEASVRNFFNIVFYDKETRSFKPEFLTQMEHQHGLRLYQDVSKKGKPGQMGVAKGLLAFYTRNQDSSQVSLDLVRDDWSRRVISNLPGVRYLKGGGQCEMNAGVDNALKVMGTLLGDPRITESGDPLQRKSALDRLCEVVSRDGFQLSWKSQSHSYSPQNMGEKLIFSMNGKPSFQWSFQPSHFSLTEIKDQSVQNLNWVSEVPQGEAPQKLGQLWNPVEKKNYSTTPFSHLWNQKIDNSQVRLDLLDRAPWSESLGSIAYRFTRGFSLQDEAVHQKVSVASAKTHHTALTEALAHAPAGIRARSAALSNAIEVLNILPSSALRERDSSGRTPGHLAAREGRLEALRVITRKAPETLMWVDYYEITPAHLAAQQGKARVLRVIAENVPETLKAVNESKSTPAHWAANGGHAEALSVIAEYAPETLRAVDSLNETPAHFAAAGGHVEALKVILEKAPETLRVFDRYRRTPAYEAARQGRIQALRFIAEKDPETLVTIGQTALDQITNQELREEIQEIINQHKSSSSNE